MIVPETFVTFNSLARRTGVPACTLYRRIRKLEIVPDGQTDGNTPVMLFRFERLPELRRQLAQPDIVL
jgi:transposase-like protein